MRGASRADPDHGSWGERTIVITAKFRVKTEHADRWPEVAADFTEATHGEPGCLWFDWSPFVDDPTEYVLVRAFRDAAAGGAPLQSPHFEQARQAFPPYLAATPKIVHGDVPQDDWSPLGELQVADEG